MILKALFEISRYLKIHLFGLLYLKISKKGRKKQGKKVYVTLTTTPDRIKKIKPTIISLIDQSVRVDRIILNIPTLFRDIEPYYLPDYLNSLSQLDIKIIPKDLGPATKLLPTLNIEYIGSDDLIIVLDDDQVYPCELVEKYLLAEEKHTETALTLCGWQLPDSRKHRNRVTLRGAGVRLFSPHSNINQDMSVDIFQGASSYMVKKKFFDQSVFDYRNAPREAFFVDDIWFSGHLAKRGVGKIVFRSNMPYMRIESLITSTKTGLVNTNNKSDNNNDKMYEWFEDYWIKN